MQFAIVEISSDEDDEDEKLDEFRINEYGNKDNTTSDLFQKVDYTEWLDDVIIPDAPSIPLGKRKRIIKDVCDDGDCQILDQDCMKISPTIDEGNVDELQIVGEKGQVACRDYPHSRHLCANFPFNSTAHNKHCSMCHCYVCDLRAPCIHWGTGADSADHCHATDHIITWKALRQSYKLKGLPASQANVPGNSITAYMLPPRQRLRPCPSIRKPVHCTFGRSPHLGARNYGHWMHAHSVHGPADMPRTEDVLRGSRCGDRIYQQQNIIRRGVSAPGRSLLSHLPQSVSHDAAHQAAQWGLEWPYCSSSMPHSYSHNMLYASGQVDTQAIDCDVLADQSLGSLSVAEPPAPPVHISELLRDVNTRSWLDKLDRTTPQHGISALQQEHVPMRISETVAAFADLSPGSLSVAAPSVAPPLVDGLELFRYVSTKSWWDILAESTTSENGVSAVRLAHVPVMISGLVDTEPEGGTDTLVGKLDVDGRPARHQFQ